MIWRRMRLLLLTLLCACTKEPDWSRATARNLGDDTITRGGAPVHIPRMTPQIDGLVDEWGSAATLGPFVDTGSGHVEEKHPIATFARAGWDDQNLYLAFVVRDRSPSSPFGRDDNDPHIWGKSSGVEI